MHLPILLLSILAVTSCGKSNSSAGMPRNFNPQSPPITNEVMPQKQYLLSNLVAINPELTGDVSGRLAVEQTGFNYNTTLTLSTATWHQDSIHSGSRCPTKADDVNGDMVIDAGEANAVVGSELVFLNDNSRNSTFTGNFDLNGKAVLINSATEAMACGILKVVSGLPADTGYEPQPTPEPRPTPTPQPRPTPAPERDEDDDNDSWIDRFNEWWRCRLGGC